MLLQGIGVLALLAVLIGGYTFYQGVRDRELAERLKKMRDTNSASAEVDKVIAQSQAEAEFFRRNRGKY